MSQQSRTTLKSYFRTGKRPTQEQFAELIDAGLNLADSDLFEADGSLGLGHDQPLARLSVGGNLSVSPNNDSAPDNGLFVHGNVGIGAGFTDPTARLAVNGSVYIGDTANTDPGSNGLRVDGDVTAGGNLTLDNNKHVAADRVQARDSGGLKFARSNGTTELKIHNNGKLSIGTESTSWAKVNVEGSVRASNLLQAASLKLTGDVQQTGFHGYKDGTKYGNWIIDVPDNKVVSGIHFERWREGDGDKDFYRIALRYK